MKTITVKFEKETDINKLNQKLKDAKLREWAIFTELFINFELTLNSKQFINTLNLIHTDFEIAYKQFWKEQK